MFSDTATIQVFRSGAWVSAACFRPAEIASGCRAAGELEYQVEYSARFAGPQNAQAAAISCAFPVDFDLHQLSRCPAFLLDLLPNGFGRLQWLEQLESADNAAADWPLLLRGTAFPPGNVRIAEAVEVKNFDLKVPTSEGRMVAMRDHPGFSRDEVLQRTEAFIY